MDKTERDLVERADKLTDKTSLRNWLHDALTFAESMKCKNEHPWCKHRQVFELLIKNLYPRCTGAEAVVQLVYDRLTSTLSTCTACISAWHEVQEEFEDRTVEMCRHKDAVRLVKSLEKAKDKAEEVTPILFEVLCFYGMLNDGELNRACTQYMLDNFNAEMCDNGFFIGAWQLLAHENETIRSQASGHYTRELTSADDILCLEPLLVDWTDILKNGECIKDAPKHLPDSFQPRDKYWQQIGPLWQGLISFLSKLKGEAMEALVENHPEFVSVILQKAQEWDDHQEDAVRCVLALVLEMGPGLWKCPKITPLNAVEVFIGICFRINNVALHKLSITGLASILESSRGTSHSLKVQKRVLYFLLFQVWTNHRWFLHTVRGQALNSGLNAIMESISSGECLADFGHLYGPALKRVLIEKHAFQVVNAGGLVRPAAANLACKILLLDGFVLATCLQTHPPLLNNCSDWFGVERSTLRSAMDRKTTWCCVPQIWSDLVHVNCDPLIDSSISCGFLVATAMLSRVKMSAQKTEVNVGARPDGGFLRDPLDSLKTKSVIGQAWQEVTGWDDHCRCKVQISGSKLQMFNALMRAADSHLKHVLACRTAKTMFVDSDKCWALRSLVCIAAGMHEGTRGSAVQIVRVILQGGLTDEALLGIEEGCNEVVSCIKREGTNEARLSHSATPLVNLVNSLLPGIPILTQAHSRRMLAVLKGFLGIILQLLHTSLSFADHPIMPVLLNRVFTALHHMWQFKSKYGDFSDGLDWLDALLAWQSQYKKQICDGWGTVVERVSADVAKQGALPARVKDGLKQAVSCVHISNDVKMKMGALLRDEAPGNLGEELFDFLDKPRREYPSEVSVVDLTSEVDMGFDFEQGNSGVSQSVTQEGLLDFLELDDAVDDRKTGVDGVKSVGVVDLVSETDSEMQLRSNVNDGGNGSVVNEAGASGSGTGRSMDVTNFWKSFERAKHTLQNHEHRRLLPQRAVSKQQPKPSGKVTLNDVLHFNPENAGNEKNQPGKFTFQARAGGFMSIASQGGGLVVRGGGRSKGLKPGRMNVNWNGANTGGGFGGPGGPDRPVLVAPVESNSLEVAIKRQETDVKEKEAPRKVVRIVKSSNVSNSPIKGLKILNNGVPEQRNRRQGPTWGAGGQAKRVFTMDHVHEELLSWDIDTVKSGEATFRGIYKTTVPEKFNTPDQYMKVFKGLLMEELRAALLMQWEEMEGSGGKPKSASLRVNHVQRSTRCHNIKLAFNPDDDVEFRPDDLLIVSAKPLNFNQDLPAQRILALVKGVSHEYTEDGQKTVEVKMRFEGADLGAYASRNDPSVYVKKGWKCHSTGIMSLVTHFRELQALADLHTLPAPRVNQMLDPQPPIHNIITLSKANLPMALAEDIRTKFNASQQKAVATALGGKSIFTLVQGPPGTGKTSAILGMISGLLSTIPAQLSKQTSEEQPNPQFTVPPRNKRRARQTVTTVGAQAKSSNAVRLLVCAQSNAAIDELIARISVGGIVCANGTTRVPRMVRMGRLDVTHNEVQPFHIDSLCIKQMETDEEAAEASRVTKEASEELGKLRAELDKAKAELALAEKVGQGGENQQNTLRDRIRRLNGTINRVRSRFKDSRKDVEQAKKFMKVTVLRDAEIVFSTLSSAAGDLMNICSSGTLDQHISFNALIVDEAAQALEPATLVPLRLLRPSAKIVLVGDPRQLPPTVFSKLAESKNFARSMFERFEQAGYPVVMLSEQYRMHPKISRFPSLQFYNNELVNGDGITEASRSAPFHRHKCFSPFVFFDCLHGKESRSRRNKGSIENQMEADFVAMLFAGVKTNFPDDVGGVAIIAPYKAQVNRLKRSLEQQPTLMKTGSSDITDQNVEVATVDSFQGREADIVIISLVRAQDAGEKSTVGFLNDVRRMNVALTRPRRALWVVGHSKTLQKNKQWAAFLDHARGEGCYMEVGPPFRDLLESCGVNPDPTLYNSRIAEFERMAKVTQQMELRKPDPVPPPKPVLHQKRKQMDVDTSKTEPPIFSMPATVKRQAVEASTAELPKTESTAQRRPIRSTVTEPTTNVTQNQAGSCEGFESNQHKRNVRKVDWNKVEEASRKRVKTSDPAKVQNNVLPVHHRVAERRREGDGNALDRAANTGRTIRNNRKTSNFQSGSSGGVQGSNVLVNRKPEEFAEPSGAGVSGRNSVDMGGDMKAQWKSKFGIKKKETEREVQDGHRVGNLNGQNRGVNNAGNGAQGGGEDQEEGAGGFSISSLINNVQRMNARKTVFQGNSAGKLDDFRK